MESKNYFNLLIIVLFAASIIYFVGCNQQNFSEPENKGIATSELPKTPDSKPISLEKRKILLQKFLIEIEEARVKVKAKWAKLKNNKLLKTTLLPAEEEAMDLANAITPSAYSYIQSAYGVDLYNYFSPGDPNIALTGTLVAQVDSDMLSGTIYQLDGDPLFSVQTNDNTSTKSQNHLNKTTKVLKAKWIACMEEAVGVSGFVTLLSGAGASALSATGVIKLAGKVLAKYLTWIGAAVALTEFTYCMFND